MVGATRFELATPCTPCKEKWRIYSLLDSFCHRIATRNSEHAAEHARLPLGKITLVLKKVPVDVKRRLYVFMAHQRLDFFQIGISLDED